MIDTERALLMHRPGEPPTLAFRAGDVEGSQWTTRRRPRLCDRALRCRRCLVRGGRAAVRSPAEPVPPGRLPALDRALRVEADGTVLVDTTETMVVYETALDHGSTWTRGLVRVDLTRSQPQTYCPYKGTATYWNAVVNGVVLPTWRGATRTPLPESSPLQHLVSFDDQRVSVVHDLPTGRLTPTGREKHRR